MKAISALINSNIYISLAAVMLTVSAQIQLGMPAQWHPYLFIIFFATLFEYNLHRLITVLTNKEALNSDKHRWVRENMTAFYVLVILSVTGFISVAVLAKKEVLYTFAPIAAITFFYSIPVSGNRKHLIRLREIPYLKIFLIAFVWSGCTILLPVIQSDITFEFAQITALFAERFFFILAITIPFDIRDLEVDRKEGIKTIPMAIGAKRAMLLSYTFLFLFPLTSFIQSNFRNESHILAAISISALSTFIFLKSNYFRRTTFYYYGILDGTMLLQGILVVAFHYITCN